MFELVLAAMLAWVPIRDHRPERPEVTSSRYEAIARDIGSVVAEAEGERVESAEFEALILASIASFESSFAARVDDCREGRGGAWSIFQVTATRRHPKAAICGSRKTAAAWALREVRESAADCRRLPFEDLLGIYADGRCSRGNWRSRSRVMRAASWLAQDNAT